MDNGEKLHLGKKYRETVEKQLKILMRKQSGAENGDLRVGTNFI